jgi:hypothetical protein
MVVLCLLFASALVLYLWTRQVPTLRVKFSCQNITQELTFLKVVAGVDDEVVGEHESGILGVAVHANPILTLLNQLQFL